MIYQRPQNGGPANGRSEPRAQNPPPGGAAGVAQQTAATQLVTYGSMLGIRINRTGYRDPRTPRRKARRVLGRAPPRRVQKRKRNGGKRAHMVKGSPAAKRFMAKLRRMQKRKR